MPAHFKNAVSATERLSPVPEAEGGTLHHQFIQGPLGPIETVSITPAGFTSRDPVLYFLPGWWGNLSHYTAVLHFFAGQGFRCRCMSWRGTGRSGGRSFWGLGFEHDLVRMLEHFRDPRVILVPHSGAVDPVRLALPILHASGFQPVEAAIFIAPLARSGSMGALLEWLRPDNSGTNLTRFLRFLGSNLLGVSWFMRNELAVRRVLLSDQAPARDVQRVIQEIDHCPFGRYFLSLWRFPEFLQYSRRPLASFGVQRAIVMHAERDRNFAEKQQTETAEALGAEFVVLPNTCHQWFAEAESFRTTRDRILRWLDEQFESGGADRPGAAKPSSTPPAADLISTV